MPLASSIEGNAEAFYAHIRIKRVTRDRLSPLKDKEGNLCLEPEEVGKVLNEYFTLVFTKERDMDVDIQGHAGIKKEVILGVLEDIRADENVDGLINRFADDMKTDGVMGSEKGCQRIEQDVDQLEGWAENWQMEFNLDKCNVMHFGRSNAKGKHTVNGRTLRSISIQRDLGVQVHSSLKAATQVIKVVKKAYGMLAFIGQTNGNKSWQVMLQLCKTLARPYLKDCVRFRLSHYRKYLEAL
eukprot:g42407.t1